MEQLAQLVREVERVVTAPYVPSLQGLYDLLQSCSPSIESWALCKPCQVGLMADVLVDALPRSRVAVPLVSAFASTRAVRDAILERHPVVLDQFLEKAVNGESEYYSACIAFFASPLPEGFVPPARIAAFLPKLVSVMVANPCVHTVTSIHALITGLKVSPHVLNDVPSQIMSDLQLEFTKTLRNLDDHMGNLLCLSTFAQIATARLAEPQNQHGSERQWLLNIKHFFGAKRGIKTLDLVVLRVILACSSSCNLGPQDAAASIRLAIDITDAIEPAQKQAWIASNSAKVSKLCEKAVKDGLDNGIQKMAVVFLFSLLPEQSLSSQLRSLGLRTLLSKESQDTLESISPRLITRLAKSLAPATREAMAFVLGTFKGSQWQDRETIAALRLARIILTGLQELDPDMLSFNLNSSMNSLRQVVGETVEHFPRQPNEDQCKGLAVCGFQLCIMQNQLFLSLLGLYNAVSTTQTGGDVIMKSFMAKVERSLPDLRCKFLTVNPTGSRDRLALLSNEKPSPTHIDRNWRAGFTSAFMQDAQVHHDSMMKRIEQTCFDLERRCEDVEGPLRAVEEQRDQYATENRYLRERTEQMAKELQEKTDEVEAARRTSSEHLTEFGHEHTRLEQLLQDQYSHRDELMADIEALRANLREQQHESENAIVAGREIARSKELEMMATLTGKDDQIEELHEELGDIRSRHEQACQRVAQGSKENANARETMESLELELAGTTQKLEQARTLNVQKDDAINELVGVSAEKDDRITQLSAQEEDLRQELESLKSTLARRVAEYESQESALRQSETRLRGDIDALTREAENQASRASNEVATLSAEKQHLQSAMQAAAQKASNDVQVKTKRIHHLERKIQALRDERAAKAREFSEAQQHIGRLMGVMGFSANAPESTKHQRTRSTPYQTPAARSPQPISEDEEEDEYENQSRPSSSHSLSMGPTPKRPRSNHKSSPSYPTNPSPAAASRKSPPSATRSTRSPLADTNFNRSPHIPPAGGWKSSQVDAVPSTPTQENVEENRLRGLNLDMDLEFSKNFIFSGTDFTGSNE
ncbi:unnamed protein product [Penicillium salamii]|uniref:Uncharacterized protein n=1 Tax=Penicillium salamii TaxID=1612424 RepID=A0A9W4J1M5_9EURO|nr:unnamed protein product [Penicillium salamii]